MNLHEELVNQLVRVASDDSSDYLKISMRYLLKQVADKAKQRSVSPAPHEVQTNFLQSVALHASDRLKNRTVIYEEPQPLEEFWQLGPKGRRTRMSIRPAEQLFHIRYAA